MSMEKLTELEDINLEKIKFSECGKHIQLSFIDMYEGNDCGSIRCEQVISFNYENAFEEDFFPCHIANLLCYKGKLDNVMKKVDLKLVSTATDDTAYLLTLESGDVYINLVSRKVRVNIKDM